MKKNSSNQWKWNCKKLYWNYGNGKTAEGEWNSEKVGKNGIVATSGMVEIEECGNMEMALEV